MAAVRPPPPNGRGRCLASERARLRAPSIREVAAGIALPDARPTRSGRDATAAHTAAAATPTTAAAAATAVAAAVAATAADGPPDEVVT